MERRNFTEGKATNDERQIREEIQSFYDNLYTSYNNVINEAFQEFTDPISQHIPILSQDQCNKIEGTLTLDECWAALGTGKSPGEDGFTIEFFKYFFDIFGTDLLNSLNA